MLLKEPEMNTLVLPRPTGQDRRLRVFEVAADLIGGLRDGLLMARHYHALNSLSDAELARRGLARQDLIRAAVKAVG
jgi:hypothetical protein